VDNYIINEQTTIGAGEDNGFGGLYPGYLLNTQDNGGKGKFEGIEFSARQQLNPVLGWAPELLRGWEVFANYTKNYKGEAPNRQGLITKPLAPNFYDWNANYGISNTSPRRTWYAQVRTVIYPSAITIAPSTTDLRPTYEARHQRWDVTLRYRLSRRYAFELTGANVFADPSMDRIKAGRHIERREFGAVYALSFIADFW
jgi:outer membrane receptor protein involved in Fe transport